MSEATKININDKPLVNSVSDNATVFISDGGKLKRVALSTLTGTGDTHRAISYDFSGMGNIDTVLPGEMLFTADGEGIVFDDIKKNDIIIDTYSGKIFECTHKEDGTDGEATLFMGDTIVCIALTGAQSSDSGESSGTAVTAYKKIGYTDDCDYIVASSTSALSVFQTAVSEASDGDTILVMPGTYSGASTLLIDKDICFIGIGLPVISFPIKTQGGGIFNYETWSWDMIYESAKSAWQGFVFNNSFVVGGEANPDNDEYCGTATAVDCEFRAYTYVYGTFKGCTFKAGVSSGHYYGSGSSFESCKILNSVNCESGCDRFVCCEFYPQGESMGNLSALEGVLTGCKIYAPGIDVTLEDPHDSTFYLNDTFIFAKSFTVPNSYVVTGGYLINSTAL